jgi:hypothetical protein
MACVRRITVTADGRGAPTRLRAALGCLLLLAVMRGRTVDAQNHSAAAARECLDTISASAFFRVPVYLEAEAIDLATRVVLPGADSLATRVAAMVRSSLSDSITTLPEGEGLLRWRQVGGGIRTAVHRDGRLTWSIPPQRWRTDTLRAPSRQVLVQALTAVRDAGGRIAWPAEVPGDSLTFDLKYRWPDVGPDGKLRPLLVRDAVPVFSMAMPWSKPVVVRSPPQVHYPMAAQTQSMEGTVVLEFVVDSTGRAVRETIEERWPSDRPRLTGVSGANYREFLTAAKWGVVAARFDPATVGGCAVPQLVQWPFTFRLRR